MGFSFKKFNNPYLDAMGQSEVVDGRLMEVVPDPAMTIPPNIPVPTYENERVNGAGAMMYNPYGNNLAEPMMPMTPGINTGVVPSAQVAVPTGDLLMQAPPVPVTPQMQGLDMPEMQRDYTNMFPQYVPKPTIQEPTVPRDMKFKDSYDMIDLRRPPTVGENVGDNTMQQGTGIQLDANGYPMTIPQVGTPTAPVVSPIGQPTNEIPGLKLNVGSTMRDFTKSPTEPLNWLNDATYKPLGDPTIQPPVLTPPDERISTEPTINPQTGMIQPPVLTPPPPRPNNEPEITLPGTTKQPEVKTNEFGVPEMYYAGKAILDAGALFNNMVQAPPPNMQFETPKFERMRLDRTPFETARTDVREAQVASNRTMREGMSQASDLMRGLSAVTAGTQENMSQIGTQEAGAQLQVEQQNQQIAMQEAQAQNAINNQEMQVNYLGIQQQAQARKDELISTQLGRIGDTAGAYAKYNAMKEMSQKQEDIQRESVLASNEIQSAMLEWQMAQNELTSPEYDGAEKTAFKQKLTDNAKALLGDERYAKLREASGGQPSFESYSNKAYDQDFMKNYGIMSGARENFQRMYPGGAEPDRAKYTDEKQYNEALSVYNEVKKLHDSYDDSEYALFDMESKYWNEAKGDLDRDKHRASFAEEYVKSKGLLDTKGLAERLKLAMERSRQTLER